MTVAVAEPVLEPYGGAAAIAAWLAGIFIAPLPLDAVTHYSSASGALLLEAVADETGCKPGMDRMRQALAAEASPSSLERTLSIAYTQLFEGVAGPATVSLYESAYGGAESRLFQEATADMEAMLHRCGLSVTQACREPPDHLSIELALLSTTLRGNAPDCASLLRDRLRSWAPEFAARCTTADHSGFYSGAAMVLNGLLAMPAPRIAPCIA